LATGADLIRGFEAGAVDARRARLKLLSFNIQVGLHTKHYGHYVTRALLHVMPSKTMHHNLDRIAEMMGDYDFVAIQEADAGSLRSHYVNQMEYLARRAGFNHFGLSVTRNLRPVAQHCLGYLSRSEPKKTVEHVLPSSIPGRRAMTIELGADLGSLTLLIAHLSLGPRTQSRQLHFLTDLVPHERPSALIGDLNCGPEALRCHPGLLRTGLWVSAGTPATFPSWAPKRCLDHILVSPQITVKKLVALPHTFSDHRPLAAEIEVPLA
jgi:endonuclease/exonuclease/phosphatase family metal-dependent hydrolase